MIRAIVLFTLVVVTLFACSTGEKVVQNDQSEMARPIPFEIVGKGALFGAGEEGIPKMSGTIRSYQGWIDLKKKMDAVNSVSENFSEETLNFEEDMVIMCFDKVHGSGGYEIKIVDVLEKNGKIEVMVEYTSPSDMATSVMTQPFYIVQVPDSDLEVVFKEKE